MFGLLAVRANDGADRAEVALRRERPRKGALPLTPMMPRSATSAVPITQIRGGSP